MPIYNEKYLKYEYLKKKFKEIQPEDNDRTNNNSENIFQKGQRNYSLYGS